jgi:hypothetical protein
VVEVVVIVFMLVVHGRWCIMFIFIEVEASKAGFEMAVFSRLWVQRGGGFKVFVIWKSFGFLKYTGEGCVIFQRGGCSGVGGAQGAACARVRRAQA